VQDALKITDQGEVIDGRHRWRAAKRMRVNVPCVIVPPGETIATVLGSLSFRCHYNQGQRSYICAPFSDAALKESAARKAANLKHGNMVPKLAGNLQKPLIFPEGEPMRDRVEQGFSEWCKSFNLCRRSVEQARQIQETYWPDPKRRTMRDKWGNVRQDVTFQEFFEPLIMAEEHPYGLGAVIAGCESILRQEEIEAAGKKHPGGRPKEKSRQLLLFCEGMKELRGRFRYWTDFDADARAQLGEGIAALAVDMPDDLLSEWMNKLRAEQRRRSSGGE
jgi:hypothetical protein